MGQTTHKVLVVLGMHRSGTSLAGNVLSSLGVEFGDDLLQGREDNPLGLWEHRAIVRTGIHINRLMARLPMTPTGVLPYPDNWWREARVAPLRDSLKKTVAAELAKGPALWGFKDPHAMRMVPLWKDIFAELSITPVWLLAFRNPAAVAASLTRRDGIDAEHAELLWLIHYADAIAELGQDIAGVIEYERWFSEPRKQLHALSSLLERNHLDAIPEERTQHALTSIRPELWNQRPEQNSVTGNPIVAHAYAELRRAAETNDSSALASACAQWRSAMNFFNPWAKLAARATEINCEALTLASDLIAKPDDRSDRESRASNLARNIVSGQFTGAGEQGRRYAELGLHELACEAFAEAVQRRPEQAWGWHNLAAALVQTGRHQEAVDALEEAIARSPSEAAHRGSLAETLMKLGQTGRAASAYVEAARLPSSGAAHHWLQAAMAFLKIGRIEDARSALDRAVDLNPGRADIRASRGRVLAKLGMYEAAVHEYARACELEPDNDWYRKRLREVSQCLA